MLSPQQRYGEVHPMVAAAAEAAAAVTLPEDTASAAEEVALAVALAADAAELAPAEEAIAAALAVTEAIARASSARKSAMVVPTEAEACASLHMWSDHAHSDICGSAEAQWLAHGNAER